MVCISIKSRIIFFVILYLRNFVFQTWFYHLFTFVIQLQYMAPLLVSGFYLVMQVYVYSTHQLWRSLQTKTRVKNVQKWQKKLQPVETLPGRKSQGIKPMIYIPLLRYVAHICIELLIFLNGSAVYLQTRSIRARSDHS